MLKVICLLSPCNAQSRIMNICLNGSPLPSLKRSNVDLSLSSLSQKLNSIDMSLNIPVVRTELMEYTSVAYRSLARTLKMY